MSEPACHYCARPAEAECPTCGRLFCAQHGDEVCIRCMAPESATPSAAVYRGSLLALAVGTLVAIFLLVRPPEREAGGDVVRTLPEPTPAVSATATPTPPAAPTTVVAGTTPGNAATPAPTGETPQPAATPTPAGERTHTVAEGDTLEEIAIQYGTTVDAILALNPGIDPTALQLGETLRIPPAE